MINQKYVTKNRKKFLLKCHLIFVTKYRRKIFNGSIKSNLELILSSLQYSDFNIELFEFDKDHLHMLIDYQPTVSRIILLAIIAN